MDRIVDLSRLGLMRRKPNFITLAESARDAGQWELAAGLYRKALDRYPRNSGVWVQYGHALKESGEQRDPNKLARAESAYRKALSLDPGVADSHLQLGHVLKLQGKTEEAKAAYLRAFALDPSMPDPLQELSGLGWSEAEMDGLRGLVGSNLPPASSPTFEPPLRNDARRGLKALPLGSMRRKSSVIDFADRARDARQWERAAQLYRKALERNRRNPPIWVQYGHALKESGERRDPDKLAQAETAYRRALSLDPGAADTYLQLGHVLKLQCRIEEARAVYLRALALDPSLDSASSELTVLGWSDAHFSELRAIFSTGSSSPTLAESEDAGLISQSGIFDAAWYLERHEDVRDAGLDPLLHYLRSGAKEGRDPHPLFDSDWYLATNPDVAAIGVNPLVHYIRFGAGEGRAPHPLFDAAWYLKTNPDVAASRMNPLVHYLAAGGVEGRAPHPQFSSILYLARNPEVAERGINPLVHYVLSGASEGYAPSTTGPRVAVPDLFELRALNPRGRIAVVLHLYYAEFWDDMRQAIERISEPFDLFVSLTKGASAHMREQIKQAFPSAWVFDFENRGRDIGPFLVFLRSGVLFRYELLCKLHTKLSPHIQENDGWDYPDGNTWRRALIDGVLGSPGLVDRILSNFRADPDLGMVVADGNIFRGHNGWAPNEKLLAKLLPRIGISPDVKDRSFPGGSIFWIRSFLLRTLASARMSIDDFDPEPLKLDGSLVHAVERMFGLICEDAGMRVAETGQLAEAVQQPSWSPSKVHLIAFYLPQFHPIPENDTWWGAGFTEWTNVTRAEPLYTGHRQPRIPSDLGFYDLRLPEVREAQANLARRYGLSAFCYYYYWFNGRRLLERPLDEVVTSGRPEFPFMICWANEPWTRNWDGLNRDVLLPQTYQTGWAASFAHDVAPLLRDPRYFRLAGKPMLLIYRIMHIPAASAAMHDLRATFSEEGIPDVHLAAAWAKHPGDDDMPEDPNVLGLDGYFEFPPHMAPSLPLRPVPPDISPDFTGRLWDYNRTVTAALARLDDPVKGRRHRGVMAGWDNTPRTKARAHIFHGATPTNFRRWLRGTITHEYHQDGDRVVFINAWNEWAESTYLEPDNDFGCGWLEAVASATEAACSQPQEAVPHSELTLQRARRRVLLIGHDAHPHGAQMNLLGIVRAMHREFGLDVHVLLLDGGSLLPLYRDCCDVTVTADGDETASLVRSLALAGYDWAIANTVVSGSVVPILKSNGFTVVSLIHELPALIAQYGLHDRAATIVRHSDTVVFASTDVRERFCSAFGTVSGKIIIRPQGLYKSLKYDPTASAELRAQLGLSASVKIVINIGFADMRKGTDIYIQTAIRASPLVNLHFIWVGHIHGELEVWLKEDLARCQVKNFTFLPYSEDVSRFLSAADVFFLSSREDPFPSVVLEALAMGLPVVGFDGAGGFGDLLQDPDLGALVPYGDVEAAVEAIARFTSAGTTDRTRVQQCEAIRKRYRVQDYAFDLLREFDPNLRKISVILPNYNHEKYVSPRLESIFGQTYPVYECIVLDDASSDGSREVIIQTAEGSKRDITAMFYDVNSGNVFRQWQRGVDAAAGELVWVAESDDLSEPGFLEELAGCYLHAKNVAFAFSDSIPVNGDGDRLGDSYKEYYATLRPGALATDLVIESRRFALEYLTVKNLILNVSAVLWNRTAICNAMMALGAELYEFALAGDWRLYAEVCRGGGLVHYRAAPLNIHRRHESSVTGALDRKRHLDEIVRMHAFLKRAFDPPNRVQIAEYEDEVARQFDLSLEVLEDCRARWL